LRRGRSPHSSLSSLAGRVVSTKAYTLPLDRLAAGSPFRAEKRDPAGRRLPSRRWSTPMAWPNGSSFARLTVTSARSRRTPSSCAPMRSPSTRTCSRGLAPSARIVPCNCRFVPARTRLTLSRPSGCRRLRARALAVHTLKTLHGAIRTAPDQELATHEVHQRRRQRPI